MSRIQRGPRRLAATSAITLAAFALAACGGDDSSDLGNAASTVSSAVGSAGSTARSAVENATDGNSSATGSTRDEGPARESAEILVAALQALPDGGEPTVANLRQIAGSAPGGVRVTGIDDSDGNGRDDDAKATVEANTGEDKACMQHQNGAWEVTDDEC